MEGAANEPKGIRRKEVPDYSFAFNESRFSDRTLQIVISMEPQGIIYDGATFPEENDDGNGAIKFRNVQVSSAILAESSQFFNKLFSSGMRETEQRHVTIHISPSEEQAFTYLLKFMYGGTIETQSTEELLDLLMLADKFEVASCIHGCSNALNRVPMTIEFASLLLCLPSSLLTTDVIGPKVKAAEGFLLTHFCDLKFAEEYLNLPLQVIEQLLKSDELHVPSEDDIYDFVINWANTHYHDQDERRRVFQNKLIKLIRFPQMTDYKLEEILSNEDMQRKHALKLVLEALRFKGRSSPESYNLEDKRVCKRSYKWTSIRVIELNTPKREYRVFWDFDKTVVLQRSQNFYMWGRQFSFQFCAEEFFLHFESLSGCANGQELSVEYVVFFRSKISNKFCELMSREQTCVSGTNSDLFHLASNAEDYNFNNVIYVMIVFNVKS